MCNNALYVDTVRALKMAKEACVHCRLTKSTTKVGCCLVTTHGNYYAGCNFDAAFGVTMHAEINAINHFVITGSEDERIAYVVMFCTREEFTPCGACRDQLFYFGIPGLKVLLDNGKLHREYSIEELYPKPPRR